MSRRALLPALAAFALSPAAAATPFPDTPLRTEADEPLLPAAGWRVAYVDFWASWCAPCRLSFPWMNEMHAALAGAGLRIVAVNLDRSLDDARRFLARHPARFALAFDPRAALAEALEVRAMPTSLIVAADRRVLQVHRGFRAEDGAALEAQLRAALAS